MPPYTARDNTASIDVVVQGGPGDAQETWTVTAAGPIFDATDFSEAGVNSQALAGPIFDGRDYQIVFADIAGYTTPVVGNVTASAITPQTFTGNYVVTATVGNLIVDMTGVPAGASWDINTGLYTGTTGQTLTNVPYGDYTITWLDTAVGYNPPAPEGPITLNAGSDPVSFSTPIYVVETGTITVNVTPNVGPTWTLDGPDVSMPLVGSGDQTLPGLVIGAYTIVYDDTQFDSIKPVDGGGTLTTSGLTLTGAYTARTTGSLDVDIQLDAGLQGGDEPWQILATTPFGAADFDSGAQTGDTVASITTNVFVGRSYTITYSAKPGGSYTTPNAETLAVTGAHTFIGNYTTITAVTRDLDANGWSVFNPPANGTLYVSAAGDDTWDGLSPTFTSGINGPKATLGGTQGAWSVVVDGQEWHVKLRNGDTFLQTGSIPLNKGGTTRTTPILITSYADGSVGHTVLDDRPTISMQNGADAFAVLASNVCATDLIIIWGTGRGTDHSTDKTVTGILFEGIWFQNVNGGIIDVTGSAGAATDREFRRCVYSTDSTWDGMYRSGFDTWLFEECLIDTNYHNNAFFTLDHITYWNTNDNVTVRGSILARAGINTAGAWKFVQESPIPHTGPVLNPIWENNVIDMSQNRGTGLDISGNEAGDGSTSPRYSNGKLNGNVFYGLGKRGAAPGDGGQSSDAVGPWIGDFDNLEIRDNLFVWGLRDESQSLHNGTAFQQFFSYGNHAPASGAYHITGNVFAAQWTLDPTDGLFLYTFANTVGSTFNNNIFEGEGPIVNMESIVGGTFSGNTYWSTGLQSTWFPGYASPAAWQAATAETLSDYRTSPVVFVNDAPRLTFEKYHEDVLGASSGNYETMITDMRSRYNKRDWDKKLNGTPSGTQGIWSGTNLSAWMRAGYTKA